MLCVLAMSFYLASFRARNPQWFDGLSYFGSERLRHLLVAAVAQAHAIRAERRRRHARDQERVALEAERDGLIGDISAD